MSKPARMEAERARFLSAGGESEAGIGADVLAGDRRAAAGYGPYLLPCENGFYMRKLIFDPAGQKEILRFALPSMTKGGARQLEILWALMCPQDDSGAVIF